MADVQGQGLEIEKGTPANYQPQNSRPLKPTIFVGLGGTGLKVLARFRRRLYDRYGDADHWEIYQWLGIDADQGALASGGVEDGKGFGLREKDCLAIGMDTAAMKDVLENLRGLYGHIGEWFRHDSINVSAWSFLEGAGQNRVAGRVLFVKKIDEIRQALVDRLLAANSHEAREKALKSGAHLFSADAGSPDPLRSQTADVVLVGSLAGGTGSGCFLDCAYLLQSLAQDRAAPVGEVRGMFLLPDVFLPQLAQPQQREMVQANGYAALRELEYYNSGQAHPFSTLAWGQVGQRIKQMRATPFANCYLFSVSNGQPLKDPKEMYDLLADALAFSTGGGELASRIRSCWSNAQGSVYNNRLRYRQYADAVTGDLDAAGEIGSGGNDGRTIYYERTWATRYSSMGTASLTMKLPELRRLAGVRLVRRLLDLEAEKISADAAAARAALQARAAAAGAAAAAASGGATAAGATTPDGPEALKQTDQDTGVFLAAKDFLKKLPGNVHDRIGKAAASPTAQAAESAARGLLTLLHGIATAVDSPTGPENNDARLMIAEAKNDATQTAQAAQRTWSAGGDLARLTTRMARASRALKAKTPPLKPVDGAGAKLQLQSTPLEQWKDLDAHESGPLDLLFGGLDNRARKIIRSAFKDWLTAECDGYIKRIGTGLQRHYLVQATAELDAMAAQTKEDLEEMRRQVNEEVVGAERLEKSEVAELDHWRTELARMQNDLSRQFFESRNNVVTTDLAAKADAADRPREQKLDGEIDAVLDTERFHGPHATPQKRLEEARRFALSLLAREEALPGVPPTLLQAKRDHERRMGRRLLQRLVDVVARGMMDRFPKTSDLFDALVERRVSNLTTSHLPNVINRATAYWNLNTAIDRYKQTVQHTLLTGTVLSPMPSHDRDEALEFLKQKGWFFHGPDPNERGAEGELVLMHEAHGFALQSLVDIDQWKAAYDRVKKEGQQAARHLDYRVIPDLPELVRVDYHEATGEVRSWDLAVLGIVLGPFLKWSEKQSTYMYNPTRGQPMPLGATYEAVAEWLRLNERYRRRLQEDVDAWFTERAQRPGRARDGEERSVVARREAERLVLLGLVLDLLGKKCFPADHTQSPALSPPPHTITIRLQAEKVDRFLKILTDNYPELDRRAMEEQLVGQVQRFVHFVGPKAENGAAEGGAAAGRVRHRVLQLLPEGKENEDGGKAVLVEAFNEGWYEEAQVPENVSTLFPEYGKYAHV